MACCGSEGCMNNAEETKKSICDTCRQEHLFQFGHLNCRGPLRPLLYSVQICVRLQVS